MYIHNEKYVIIYMYSSMKKFNKPLWKQQMEWKWVKLIPRRLIFTCFDDRNKFNTM